MNDNIVVSSDVATPKQRSRKQSAPKRKESAAKIKQDVLKPVATPTEGKKFVFYSSGSGYVTRSGFKFSPTRRIYEIPESEADHLLKLENFRLPDQLELEEYYKEIN
jgi:hypothetical protein